MGVAGGSDPKTSRVSSGRMGWLLSMVTLGVVVTTIAIGVARLGSDGSIEPRPGIQTSRTSERPVDDGSDARVVDLRTGEISRLPDSIARIPFDCCYSVSPDGRRLAFVGMVGDGDPVSRRYGIFVAGVDGADVQVITTDAQGARDRPQWSPDGTEVVYERGSHGGLVVVDAATGVVTPITDGRKGKYTQPTFSHDGRTILFTRGNTALWTVPATGGRESVLIEPGAYGTYSPDGLTIAYTWVGTKPVANTYRGIWLADADGGHPRPEPSGRSEGAYMGFLVGLQERSRAAWSPDGTRIAASFADGSPVIVVDVETGEVQKVAEKGQPVWLDDHTLIVDDYHPFAART